MTRSELVQNLFLKQVAVSENVMEAIVKDLLEQMIEALVVNHRIEIRGFGSFSLHYRAPRIGRNPKTGAPVALGSRHVPHFKPGKDLKDRVNFHHQPVAITS